MLFNELRLHGKLAAKRHPMYEKNKIGKYIMYASFIFWGAYFIFIGIGLAKAISTEVPNMEAVRSTHSLSFLWNIRSSHLQHRHLVTDGFQRILVSALPYAD